jgi:hypothetical protein
VGGDPPVAPDLRKQILGGLRHTSMISASLALMMRRADGCDRR